MSESDTSAEDPVAEPLFSELGLHPDVLRAVEEKGYLNPTPIQAEAIPYLLDGRDLVAGSQTGTGKTAAFCLPLLSRLGKSMNSFSSITSTLASNSRSSTAA